MPFIAAGAEEGSHATEDAGNSSSQAAVGVAAQANTAEPEAEPPAAVEEVATVHSSGPSMQAAAEGARPAVAKFVVIPSAPSSAVSSAATAEDAQDSSSQAVSTCSAGAGPSTAQRTSTPGAAQAATAQAGAAGDVRGKSWSYTWLQHALELEARATLKPSTVSSNDRAKSTEAAGSKAATGSQAAVEPCADPGTAAPAAGNLGGTTSRKGPPTSPMLKTRVLLPVSRCPAESARGGISRDGSKAASVGAEPATQQQQPSAAGGKDSNIKTGLEESSKSAAQSGAGTEAVLPDQRPSGGESKAKAGKRKHRAGKTAKGGSSPAGEPTATPQEGVVTGMAAAKDAEHPPTRATDVAGAGPLPSQQGPAGDGGTASHTSDTATAGGNSKTDRATSCPATGAEHPSGEQQPARSQEPACNKANSGRGTSSAASPRRVTSDSRVADEPAVNFHSMPAGMPDAATPKLPRTCETGAEGLHHPAARPGGQSGVGAQTIGASSSDIQVQQDQPRCGSVPPAEASIISSALPTRPAGLAPRRRAAGSERPTWIGGAALLSNFLFLLCFLLGGDRPLPHTFQAGQDTASAAKPGAGHRNSSSSALRSSAASRKLLHAREPSPAQLQGTSQLAWAAVPAQDASTKAANAEDAASVKCSIPTSSPAVAVQDARSAVAAAGGGPPEPAKPAAVQAASSSLGAAVGELHDAAVPGSLNQTRSSIVREAHGEVSVLARHDAWLAEGAVETVQGTREAAMQVGGGGGVRLLGWCVGVG